VQEVVVMALEIPPVSLVMAHNLPAAVAAVAVLV
jgi:hypothetical protein